MDVQFLPPRLPSRVGTLLRYGLLGGLLIAALQLVEYRWLVLEHSVQLYGGLVAALFAAFGIWLGRRVTGTRERVVVQEVLVPAPSSFVRDARKVAALGLTPRESRCGSSW